VNKRVVRGRSPNDKKLVGKKGASKKSLLWRPYWILFMLREKF